MRNASTNPAPIFVRLGVVSLLIALTAPLSAQVPEALRSHVVFQDNPDRFFEFTQIDAEGEETEGWVFSHWTGQWRASGELTLTDLQVVHVRHDPEINTPPVLLGVTLSVGPEGVATRQIRRMSLEGGVEIENMPPDSWVLPVPIDEGRTWSTGSERGFRWSRIEDLDGPNPNPLFDAHSCLVKMTVAAERLESGDLAVEVEESHWAEGVGLVWIDQWRGVLSDVPENVSEDFSTEEQAEHVLSRLTELPETVTLQAVPQGGAH